MNHLTETKGIRSQGMRSTSIEPDNIIQDIKYNIECFSLPRIIVNITWNQVFLDIGQLSKSKSLRKSILPQTKKKCSKPLGSNAPLSFRSSMSRCRSRLQQTLDDRRLSGDSSRKRSVDRLTTEWLWSTSQRERKSVCYKVSAQKYLARCGEDIFLRDVHAYNAIKAEGRNFLLLRLTYRSFSNNFRFIKTLRMVKVASFRESYYQSYVKLKYIQHYKGSGESPEADKEIAAIFSVSKPTSIKNTTTTIFLYILHRLKRRVALPKHLLPLAENLEFKLRGSTGIKLAIRDNLKWSIQKANL